METDEKQSGTEPEILTDKTGDKQPPVNPLRSEPILKLILKFSLPAVVGMLINAVYNIVDRAFIGNADYLGEGALAALQYCFPPMMISFGLALIFGIGGSVVYSISLGKKDYETAKQAMHTAFFLSIGLFAVLTILMAFFAEPVIQWFIPSGADSAVTKMAAQYIRITCLGLMFQSVNVFGNNFMRADGSPMSSMAAIILGAAANIILDYIFIFPLKMGVEGAALATVLAQGLASAWILYYFFGKKGNRVFRVARFRMGFRGIRIRKDLTVRIILAGMSAFVLQAAGSILTVILNYRITALAISEGVKASVAVAAMGIINSVQTIFYMPLVGLNHGLNPIIGYNYGAGLTARTKKTLWMGVTIASVFAVLGWMVTRLFPGAIIGFLADSAELAAYTRQPMSVWLGGMLLLGIAVVGGNYFQATGKAVRAMILSLLRQILIVVPLVLILPVFFGLSGVFYAQPISDGLVTGVVLILLGIEFFKNPIYKKGKTGETEISD